MSVAIISMKQMADFMLTVRRSVNNTMAHDPEKFHCRRLNGICRQQYESRIEVLESRNKDVEQFLRDCVMWNWRTYRERYSHHPEVAAIDEEEIMKQVEAYANAKGEPISREQAVFTLMSLTYNSDYDCQVEDDEEHKELLEAYNAWYKKADDMERSWKAQLVDELLESKGCMWWY